MLAKLALGAVLLQTVESGVDHPSVTFLVNLTLIKYITQQLRETLALIWALQHFDVYLTSGIAPIVVFSDHNPLIFFFTFFAEPESTSGSMVSISTALLFRYPPYTGCG